jgi:hypothetical protein
VLVTPEDMFATGPPSPSLPSPRLAAARRGVSAETSKLRIFDMMLGVFYIGRVKVLVHGRVRCVSYEEKGIWVYLVTGSALKLVACRRGL